MSNWLSSIHDLIRAVEKMKPSTFLMIVVIVLMLTLFGVIPWPIGEIRADQKAQAHQTVKIQRYVQAFVELGALQCIAQAQQLKNVAMEAECRRIVSEARKDADQ